MIFTLILSFLAVSPVVASVSNPPSAVRESTVNAPGVDVPLSRTGYQASSEVDRAGRLHISYLAVQAGSTIPQVHYRSYDSVTASWSEDECLSEADTVAGFPTLAVDSEGGAHVAWLDLTKEPYVLKYAGREAGASDWIRKEFEAGASKHQPRFGKDGLQRLWVYFSSAKAVGESERLFIYQSADRGRSWVHLEYPGEDGEKSYQEPRLVVSMQGDAIWSWIARDAGGESVECRGYDLETDQWAQRATVVSDGNQGNISDIWPVISGGRIYLFWWTRSLHRRAVWLDSAELPGLVWHDDQEILNRQVENLDFAVLESSRGLTLIWEESARSGLQDRWSVNLLPVGDTGSEASQSQVLLEGLGEASWLQGAVASGRIVFALVERKSGPARIVVYAIADRGPDIVKIWEGASPQPSEKQMLALLLGSPQRMFLLFREERPLVYQPALRLLQGDLRMIELSIQSGQRAGE